MKIFNFVSHATKVRSDRKAWGQRVSRGFFRKLLLFFFDIAYSVFSFYQIHWTFWHPTLSFSIQLSFIYFSFVIFWCKEMIFHYRSKQKRKIRYTYDMISSSRYSSTLASNALFHKSSLYVVSPPFGILDHKKPIVTGVAWKLRTLQKD